MRPSTHLVIEIKMPIVVLTSQNELHKNMGGTLPCEMVLIHSLEECAQLRNIVYLYKAALWCQCVCV